MDEDKKTAVYSVCKCPSFCKFRTVYYIGRGEDEVMCMSNVCPTGAVLTKKVDYQPHED